MSLERTSSQYPKLLKPMNMTWLQQSIVHPPLPQNQEKERPTLKVKGPQLAAGQSALSTRLWLGRAQEQQLLAVCIHEFCHFQASLASSTNCTPSDVADTKSRPCHLTLLSRPVHLQPLGEGVWGRGWAAMRSTEAHCGCPHNQAFTKDRTRCLTETGANIQHAGYIMTNSIFKFSIHCQDTFFHKTQKYRIEN